MYEAGVTIGPTRTPSSNVEQDTFPDNDTPEGTDTVVVNVAAPL